MIVLGFDTSNYTTSVAAFGEQCAQNRSQLLPVKEGELGLRQSDALFCHVRQLPELCEQLFSALPRQQIAAVGASTRPRAVEGSYMPCFLAGEGAARQLAAALGVPVDSVGVKATTTERLGFVGREEGIAAWAVCLLDDGRSVGGGEAR